jgi:hypothetical protein
VSDDFFHWMFMLDKFGDQYRLYMEQTWRFLPRIDARAGFVG